MTNRWRHISGWPVDPAVRPITRPVKKMPRWVESGWVFFSFSPNFGPGLSWPGPQPYLQLLAGFSASRSYGLGCCNVGCFVCVCSVSTVKFSFCFRTFYSISGCNNTSAAICSTALACRKFLRFRFCGVSVLILSQTIWKSSLRNRRQANWKPSMQRLSLSTISKNYVINQILLFNHCLRIVLHYFTFSFHCFGRTCQDSQHKTQR